MDKTLRFFSSGQTKDTTSMAQNNTNKVMGPTNGFRDTSPNNDKHLQNHTIDRKRKDSDNFFYIL